MATMTQKGLPTTYWNKPEMLESQKLTLLHILPSIMLYLGGIALALITFILEKASHGIRVTKIQSQSKKAARSRMIVVRERERGRSERVSKIREGRNMRAGAMRGTNMTSMKYKGNKTTTRLQEIYEK